jgi:hypothetical protein
MCYKIYTKLKLSGIHDLEERKAREKDRIRKGHRGKWDDVERST